MPKSPMLKRKSIIAESDKKFIDLEGVAEEGGGREGGGGGGTVEE